MSETNAEQEGIRQGEKDRVAGRILKACPYVGESAYDQRQHHSWVRGWYLAWYKSDRKKK